MLIMNKTLYLMNFVQGHTLMKVILFLLFGVSVIYPYHVIGKVVTEGSIISVQPTPITIKGTVKDVFGDPIIGASIIEKGTNNGTITDLAGNYTLKVHNTSTIIVSYVGYVSQEIPATHAEEIILKEDPKLLNEVVVIGYGTQRRGDVTSAITSVKAEDFAQGNSKDAGDLIKGKVAGLTVNNGSGDPNVTSSIRLRGIISLEGGNTPLVLVDGIEGSLNTVAPEDIESVDVLKDASAAAIYGTRGAAGVIIITTKKGVREQKAIVNYSGYVALSSFGKKLNMMDGTDVRNGLTQFQDKGYDTDWLDVVSRTAFTHNHNIMISGGNSHTSYNADFTFRNQQGVFINTYGKEMRFNGGLSHWFLNDKVKVSFNVVKWWHENGPVDAATTQVYRQAIIRNPTEPIYKEDGSYYENMAINYYMNPIALLKEHTGGYKTESTRLTGNITFEPLRGWQTNLMLSTNQDNAHDKGYYTSKHYDQVINYHTGYAYHSYSNGKQDNLELTSTYKHQLGDHRLEALIGYSYQYNVYEGFNANNTDFMSDFYRENNLGLGQFLKLGKANMGSYKNDDKLIGFFGRVSYGYADRYNVLLSVRREGSSKFGENHKWGTFPSASFGWMISNERFMQSFKWLNNLKIRAGYGVTGVIPSGSYQSLTRWQLGNPYYYDKGQWLQGLNIGSNPNPDLKWEKSMEYNLGIDWGVLRNRLYGSIDFYHKKTVDMLWWYDVPTPPNLYNNTLANVGKMRNMGVEISISAIPIVTKSLEWKSTLTFSHNATKLLNLSNELYETANQHDVAGLGEPISMSTQRLEVGKPLGQWYGMKSVGVSKNGLWLIENTETKEAEEFKDDMLTNGKYKQYLGNAIPKVNFGWNNYIRYKGIDLSMQFTSQLGFKILNEARAYYENNAIVYNRLKTAAEKQYGQYILSPAQKQSFVSYYLENGNYLKLSNISLGYTIPLKTNKYVNNVYVYFTADNLFTITSYTGLDPELSNSDPLNSGIDWRDKYPSIRTFTFGMKLKF